MTKVTSAASRRGFGRCSGMLADGEGGLISVQPAILDEMAASFSGVAGSTGSVRGSVSGAEPAAQGCAAAVAGSFARLQSLADAVLGGLDVSAAALSRATSSAAAAYVSTDGGLFPSSVPDRPAGP